MEAEDLVSVDTADPLTDFHEVLDERTTVSTVVGCTVDRSLSLPVPAAHYVCIHRAILYT